MPVCVPHLRLNLRTLKCSDVAPHACLPAPSRSAQQRGTEVNPNTSTTYFTMASLLSAPNCIQNVLVGQKREDWRTQPIAKRGLIIWPHNAYSFFFYFFSSLHSDSPCCSQEQKLTCNIDILLHNCCRLCNTGSGTQPIASNSGGGV